MYINEDPLWELASKWYDIAANEAVDNGARNGYRECANQLENLITAPEHGNNLATTPDALKWLDTDDPMFNGGG